MTNPYSPGKIGVTIKVPESKRYAADNPWFVFEGDSAEDIKAKIGSTFGIETEGLTLADVVINAQRIATQLGIASHSLGGTVLPQPSNGAGNGAQAGAETPPWPTGGTAPQTPAVDPILQAIENATSTDELKQLWAENQSAFADAKYMDPWKAKGLALGG